MSKSLEEVLAVRREKLAARQGIVFPNDFTPTMSIGDFNTLYQHRSREELADLVAQSTRTYKIAGRIVLHRVMGKSSFAQIADHSGIIQLFLRRDGETPGVEASTYDDFKKWDLGDIVGVEAHPYRTEKGELTLKVANIRLLTKSLRPLPDKYHGLADQELRYRQRYLDLISNPESVKIFAERSRIIQQIRAFMTYRKYLEVETPMMHPIPGGTTAKPFTTHHNTLDRDLYLRIAPELYLKRLIVGGFTKVFELNRSFRNEGLSPRHNPEFTMMEYYSAYSDYREMMSLTESVIRAVAPQYVLANGVDLSKEFEVFPMKQIVLQRNSWLANDDFESLPSLIEKARQHIKDFSTVRSVGEALTSIFEKTVEGTLLQPTFITEFPIESSPLARRNDQNPGIADRFELYINGIEIANGYSELNDPVDQAARFQQQVQAKTAGNEEAMHYDADFITALEHGMPPTAGAGLGIDRLVMLLTNQSNIRDVILFPQMRDV